MQYTVSSVAYLKIFLHCAKHPHRTVNGILLGSVCAPGDIQITDSVPLLHNWTSLSPMMEIGLDLSKSYAESQGLSVVGYYQASERLDDIALVPVGEKVASKIKESFNDAIAFVINGPSLGTPGEAALIPFISSPSWKPASNSSKAFTPGSQFQLASPDIIDRAISLVRDESLQDRFGDFDDHLEDVTIDWLRNAVALPSDF